MRGVDRETGASRSFFGMPDCISGPCQKRILYFLREGNRETGASRSLGSMPNILPK